MAVISPTAPQPVQPVAAPTPALKQARGAQNVKTETAEAVDAPDETGTDIHAGRRPKQRGGTLDITV